MKRRDDLDPELEELARTLERFDGVTVQGGRLDNAEWSVMFAAAVEDGRPTVAAWHGVEFVAWAVRDFRLAGEGDVSLVVSAIPPMLNEPGYGVTFFLSARRSSSHERVNAEAFALGLSAHAAERGLIVES